MRTILLVLLISLPLVSTGASNNIEDTFNKSFSNCGSKNYDLFDSLTKLQEVISKEVKEVGRKGLESMLFRKSVPAQVVTLMSEPRHFDSSKIIDTFALECNNKFTQFTLDMLDPKMKKHKIGIVKNFTHWRNCAERHYGHLPSVVVKVNKCLKKLKYFELTAEQKELLR